MFTLLIYLLFAFVADIVCYFKENSHYLLLHSLQSMLRLVELTNLDHQNKSTTKRMEASSLQLKWWKQGLHIWELHLKNIKKRTKECKEICWDSKTWMNCLFFQLQQLNCAYCPVNEMANKSNLVKTKLRKVILFLPMSQAFSITGKWINPAFVCSYSFIPPAFEYFKFPRWLSSYLITHVTM